MDTHVKDIHQRVDQMNAEWNLKRAKLALVPYKNLKRNKTLHKDGRLEVQWHLQAWKHSSQIGHQASITSKRIEQGLPHIVTPTVHDSILHAGWLEFAGPPFPCALCALRPLRGGLRGPGLRGCVSQRLLRPGPVHRRRALRVPMSSLRGGRSRESMKGPQNLGDPSPFPLYIYIYFLDPNTHPKPKKRG